MTNLTYATGLFNNQPVISPLAIAIVRYEQPTKKEEHNGDRDNYGGPYYGGAVVPMSMYSSPMYGSEPSTPTLPSKPNICKSKVSSPKCHKDKCAMNKHKRFRCKKSGFLAKSEKTFTIRKIKHFHSNENYT